MQAAKNGVAIDGAAHLRDRVAVLELLQAGRQRGLRRIVYGEFYRDTRIFDVAKQLGMELHTCHFPLRRTPEPAKQIP